MHERPDGFDALPKRFKDYIDKLERVNDALTAKTKTERSRVRVVKHADDHAGVQPTYLPNDVRIEWVAPKPDKGYGQPNEYDVFMTSDGTLEVHSLHGLAVLPGVSNVIYIVSRRE